VDNLYASSSDSEYSADEATHTKKNGQNNNGIKSRLGTKVNANGKKEAKKEEREVAKNRTSVASQNGKFSLNVDSEGEKWKRRYMTIQQAYDEAQKKIKELQFANT
jgi:hypothetical protein